MADYTFTDTGFEGGYDPAERALMKFFFKNKIEGATIVSKDENTIMVTFLEKRASDDPRNKGLFLAQQQEDSQGGAFVAASKAYQLLAEQGVEPLLTQSRPNICVENFLDSDNEMKSLCKFAFTVDKASLLEKLAAVRQPPMR